MQVVRQRLVENIEVFVDARKALESIFSIGCEDQKILIFLDINMPEMNGWEFLSLLQKQTNALEIKVIIVTSSLSKSDRKKSAEFKMVIDF